MSDEKIQLQVGEYYANRMGDIKGPLKMYGESSRLFALNIDDLSDEAYYPDGRWSLAGKDPRDLVEILPRTDKRHPEFNSGKEITMRQYLCKSVSGAYYIQWASSLWIEGEYPIIKLLGTMQVTLPE